MTENNYEHTIRNINDLIPYVNNSRTHSEEQVIQIASSMKEFGFTNPVLIDEQGGVIAGHGRIMAARKLAIEEIPCIVLAGLSEAQKKAYVIADNQLALNSNWDLDLLKVEAQDLSGMGFDLELLGFENDFLDSLLDENLESTEGLTDEDQVPEIPEEPITKKGDIWILGNHRLMCGDSTMIDDVERLMNGKKADMVFTDPPYQLETKGGCKGRIGEGLKKQGENIEFISNFNPLDVMPSFLFCFPKNKFNAYIFCNKDLLPDYLNWARDNKISFNVLIWKKPNPMPIGDSHRPDIEYLLLFRKNAIWNNGLKGVNYSRVIEESRDYGLHPTMKPIALIENEILISSNNKSFVLDLFGGSGSTIIASEKTNRKCYTMELLEKYCDVIIKRWQDFTGKKAVLESSGQTYEEISDAQKTTTN